jgi:aryl-alcohol dehydrogenase-like predicted oxidoreductase
MRYIKLGSTGLDISPVALGCMTFGEPERGGHLWTLPEAESRPIIRHALEAGINFFDTANVYSDGSSEEILGRALLECARREEVVIATKVHGQMRPGPNGGGLSRKAILHEVDASLKRLGTDHIDLYQIHRLDRSVPLTETLEALHDVVKAGKVRYLGASSMYAWELGKALHVQEMHGWTRFVSMQNHYNLLNREEEREMLPLCADEGVGVIPWSPLARGRLAREDAMTTTRSTRDPFAATLYDDTLAADQPVIDAVGHVAAARGVPRAQVALAWLIQQPTVCAPLVGARTIRQLDDAVAATDLHLTPDEVNALERPYVPHHAVGI